MDSTHGRREFHLIGVVIGAHEQVTAQHAHPQPVLIALEVVAAVVVHQGPVAVWEGASAPGGEGYTGRGGVSNSRL